MNRKHIGRHEPGDRRAYRAGCRCYPCSDAYAAYHKGRQHSDWKPFVEVAPVREHIASLIAAGVPAAAIARRAQVSINTLSAIRGIGRASTIVRAENAARILAVRPTLDIVGAGGYINGTGTYRRLQSLHALGFPRTFLAARVGSHHEHLKLHPVRLVRPAFAAAVQRVYDELWDQDPVACGVRPSAITVARKRAAEAGWALPAEWDDDEIDNPSAKPRRADTPRYAGHRGDELRENVRFIVENSPVNLADRRDKDAVAARLAITTDYLDKLLKTAA